MSKSVGLTEAGAPKVNEDAFFTDDSAGLYLLCDGVGGNGVGTEASALAIQIVRKNLLEHQAEITTQKNAGTKESRLALQNLIENAVTAASEAVFQAAQTDPAKKGMCTTLDILLLTATHAIISHVGSGRVYLVRGGELHQLTEDHTQLAHLKRTGRDEPPPAGAAALNKRLTRVVGYQPTVKADVFEVELEAGDRLFLCSDGVWIPVSEERLEPIATAQDTAGALQKIKEEVLRTGAKDNYTLAFITPKIPAAIDGATAGVKVQLTGKVPVFEYLTYPEVIRVLSVADLFKVNPGHLICKEGDPGSEMMLVIQGSVEVLKAGKRIAQLAKGDFFGEMSMLGVAPRSATVVAMENTHLLIFPRAALFELLRQEPGISVKFLWGISQELNKRLRATSNQLVGQNNRGGVEKLERSQLPFLYT